MEWTKPNAPTLSESDMRVVQVNTQINAAIDTTTIKNTAALIADDKTKIDSLKSAIADLNLNYRILLTSVIITQTGANKHANIRVIECTVKLFK